MTLMNSLTHVIFGSVLVVAGVFLAWEALCSARCLFISRADKCGLFVLWAIAGGLMAYGSTLIIQVFTR